MMRFLDNKIFERFEFRQGDIILLSPPKCGAHWSMMMVYSVLSKGKTSFSNIHDVVPWMEFVEYPGQTVESRCKRAEERVLTNSLQFRVFESHSSIAPGPVPFDERIKYVITARCPFDMVVSLYHHVMSSNDDFLHGWGLDGEGGLKDRLGSVEKIVQGIEQQLFPKDLWEFYIRAWKLKSNKNILLQHFSDMKRNLKGAIEDLDKFFGTNLTQKELENVCEVSSFNWMKAHSEKFNASTIGLFSKEFHLIHPVHPTEIIRYGGVNYSEEISEEQRERIFSCASKIIDDKECLSWVFNGKKNT